LNRSEPLDRVNFPKIEITADMSWFYCQSAAIAFNDFMAKQLRRMAKFLRYRIYARGARPPRALLAAPSPPAIVRMAAGAGSGSGCAYGGFSRGRGKQRPGRARSSRLHLTRIYRLGAGRARVLRERISPVAERPHDGSRAASAHGTGKGKHRRRVATPDFKRPILSTRPPIGKIQPSLRDSDARVAQTMG